MRSRLGMIGYVGILVLIGSMRPLFVAAQDHVQLRACLDSCATALSEGAYPQAMEQAEQAMRIARVLHDSSSMAGILVRKGTILMGQGDYNRALMEIQQALRISEALGDRVGVADAYSSIGSIHYYDRNYASAYQYYLRSLAILERTGEQHERAILYGNIGSALEEMDRLDSALIFHRMHLAIRREAGDERWIPICYSNLGVCFDKLGASDSALHYLEASLALTSEGDRNNHARTYTICMLGVARLHAGRIPAAIATCNEGLSAAQGLGDLPMKEQCYHCLYQAHAALGDTRRALEMHERFIEVRDSITGEQRAKELIRTELTYHFEQTRLADSLVRVDTQRQADFAYQQKLAKERDQKRVFLFSGLGVLLLAGGLWNRLRFIQRSRNIIKQERDRSDKLLLNILPAPIADELKATGQAKAREVEEVSILFTDFHDFTLMTQRLSPQGLVAEIDACFRAFDRIAASCGLEKIKTIGDAYMAAAGLPDPRPASAKDAVLAALGMQDWMKERALENGSKGRPYFTMRAGIHTGPVVAGIVGESKFQYDVWGDTVNTAARMESASAVGEVNISEATFEVLREEPDLHFSPRGRLQVKGKGELAMFFVRKIERASGSG